MSYLFATTGRRFPWFVVEGDSPPPRAPSCSLDRISPAWSITCRISQRGTPSVNVISAYFQYAEDINTHLQHLGLVLDAMRGHTTIVGVDTNAHSPLWHCAAELHWSRSKGHPSTRTNGGLHCLQRTPDPQRPGRTRHFP